MATSSKNKNKGRIVFSVIVMLLFGAALTFAAEHIWNHAERDGKIQFVEEQCSVNSYLVSQMCQRFYVLYTECMMQGEEAPETVGDLFIGTEDTIPSAAQAKSYAEQLLQDWESNMRFLEFYYAGNDREKNMAGVELQSLLSGTFEADTWEQIKELYQCCVVLSVDKMGNFSVEIPYSVYEGADAAITRMFFEIYLSKSLEDQVMWYMVPNYGEEVRSEISFAELKPFEVVFALPHNGDSLLEYYSSGYSAYAVSEEVSILYAVLITGMLLLVLFARRKRRWEERGPARFKRKGVAYFAELAVVGLCMLEPAYFGLLYAVGEVQHLTYTNWQDVEVLGSVFAGIVLIELLFFLCFWYLRPLFSLGIKEYLKEYSLICALCRGLVRLWKRFVAAIDSMDFSQKSTKLLLKVVLVNFLVLLLCVSCWFFGIIGLVIYSVGLFCFLKQRYDKAAAGYNEVLRETHRIAEGELSTPVEGDFGMFAPLGEELGKVKEGFGKAVAEEVKSERMKTELITNVSHDLKTPLTAIMTYVELLNQEDITEEERSSYIETLENKSKRLKVLIEDLFEVSKAASNTLTLHHMEVDLAQLVKQMAVEYEERFAAAELQLRQTMPEEKLSVWVDGQKTSRILENLFTNVCKYAMPGSRVYASVFEKADTVWAEVKNVSAVELTVNAEEITERFVRGDASRNTEGSGLGLAIAKNLTEVQDGTFYVEIDGDLFKVAVGFPRYLTEKKEDTLSEE